jgi:hypothetical protein
LNVCPSGCAFLTIQSAIDAAANGDSVQIAAGRYSENLTIIGKRLTLSGVPAGSTVITEVVGSGHGPVIVLGSGTATTYEEVDIHNLTISHGDHESGTGVGGGIQVRSGAFLHLANSVLTHNIAQLGAGIGVNTPGGPATTLTSCLIDDNVAVPMSNLSQGAVFGLGGGVFAASGSTVAVLQSTVTRNHSLSGGGLYSDTSSHLTVDGTTVSENVAAQVHAHLGFSGGSGGGLDVNSDLTLSRSVIAHNSALGPETPQGGGLFILVVGGKQSISQSVIAHNLADTTGGGNGGGVFATAPSKANPLTLDDDYIVQNQAAAGLVGGLALGDPFALTLTDTTIKDNSGINCGGAATCPP